MNYFEKYSVLHASLGWHSIDLGYGYWSTATGGTIYLFFPKYDTYACEGALQTIIEEHQLLSWPIRGFKTNVRYKRLYQGLGLDNRCSCWPYAYVFHLWKKRDRDKLKDMKIDIECLAWELTHGSEDYLEEDDYLSEE